MDTITHEEAIAMSLGDELIKMDEVFDSTAIHRQSLSDKMMQAAMDIDLANINGLKPMDRESRISVIKAAGDMLDSIDKQQTTRVTTKLRVKSDDDDSKIASSIVTMLPEIGALIASGGKGVNMNEIDAKLNEVANEAGIELTEGELREDPNDFS